MRLPSSAVSAGARSHSSTMTGGCVEQDLVPYPQGGAQTQRSQLGEDFIGLYTSTLYTDL